MQHGLLCRDVVLPGEDAEAFEDLRNRVWADLAPAGPVEELLTDRVVNAMWRLRRLERVEGALFDWRIHQDEAHRLGVKAGRYVQMPGGLSSMNLGGQRTIRDQASYDRAMEEFRSAESERDRAELSLGCAFDADAKDGETFGKLSRYETAIERFLFRSLHELRQVQERRPNCTAATNHTVNGGHAKLPFDTAEVVA
jgi:hypothetical protein